MSNRFRATITHSDVLGDYTVINEYTIIPGKFTGPPEDCYEDEIEEHFTHYYWRNDDGIEAQIEFDDGVLSIWQQDGQGGEHLIPFESSVASEVWNTLVEIDENRTAYDLDVINLPDEEP
jgi:hypothetical protein